MGCSASFNRPPTTGRIALLLPWNKARASLYFSHSTAADGGTSFTRSSRRRSPGHHQKNRSSRCIQIHPTSEGSGKELPQNPQNNAQDSNDLNFLDTLTGTFTSQEEFSRDSLLLKQSLRKIREGRGYTLPPNGVKTPRVELFDVFFSQLSHKPALLEACFGVGLKERSKAFTLLLESVQEIMEQHCKGRSILYLNIKPYSSTKFTNHMDQRTATAEDLLLIKKALVNSLKVVIPMVEDNFEHQTAILEAWSKGLSMLFDSYISNSTPKYRLGASLQKYSFGSARRQLTNRSLDGLSNM